MESRHCILHTHEAVGRPEYRSERLGGSYACIVGRVHQAMLKQVSVAGTMLALRYLSLWTDIEMGGLQPYSKGLEPMTCWKTSLDRMIVVQTRWLLCDMAVDM